MSIRARLTAEEYSRIYEYRALNLSIPEAKNNAKSLVDSDRTVARLTTQLRALEDKYKSVESDFQNLLIRNDILASLQVPHDPITIFPKSKSRNEAVAIACASDWHVEEKVDPNTLAGILNEYNPDIAEARAKRFFQNALMLAKMHARDVDISEFILWLGGDLLTGYIHRELLESNYMSPINAVIFLRRIIRSGIDFILNNSKFRISVPCSPGNHGRTTDKLQISTSADNSYEYLLYCILADDYKSESRVRFHVSKAYHTIIPVYNRLARFHHGDAIKYKDGVGGITIPVNKKIMGWNKTTPVDMDFMGHFHQLIWGSRVVVNGSMIGYTPFAQRMGAEPEQPQQAFCLWDKHRGRTMMTPIFLI